MPVKFYTAQDLGGGVQVVNTPDPVNPGDVATKHYVDTRTSAPLAKQILWENAYAMSCGNNTYQGGGYILLSTGPSVQTITKRRSDTGIRVTFSGTCYANQAGQVSYAIRVNGSFPIQMFVYYVNTINTHITLPWTVETAYPASYPQVGLTGDMIVNFYIATSAGVTWNTDANDFAAWTISEVMP